MTESRATEHDLFREPRRDPALGAALAAVVGRPPVDEVDFDALAARIASVSRCRPASPWWSYAAGWEARALPVALAAGLAGIFTLWSLGMPAVAATEAPVAPDAVIAVMDGTPAAEAARSLAQSLTTGDALATERW